LSRIAGDKLPASSAAGDLCQGPRLYRRYAGPRRTRGSGQIPNEDSDHSVRARLLDLAVANENWESVMIKIGILGSGSGSNCRAILQSIRDGKLNAKATVVISDVLDAPILEIAREFGVANAYLPPGHFQTRLEPKVEAQLVEMLQDAEVELVVLAGFMRVLKEQMLAAF